MDRIQKLCSYLDVCDLFADVGCDHGYCTLYALKSGKCKSAYISDVSEKCLSKAQQLLKKYIADGRCTAVCCDGLKDIPRGSDEVLIAGMGGMEIKKIISDGFIPKKFVLQPMHDAPALRKFLIDCGCAIRFDGFFRCGDKYYFIIKGERDGSCPFYSEEELAFGRDSIRDKLFKEYAKDELSKLESYLVSCRDGGGAEALIRRINLLKKTVAEN